MGVRSYHLVAVEVNAPLLTTLEHAKEGATPEALAGALVQANPEVTLAEAKDYVNELIGTQILVSELAPVVTGPEPVYSLMTRLRGLPAPAPTLSSLSVCS